MVVPGIGYIDPQETDDVRQLFSAVSVADVPYIEKMLKVPGITANTRDRLGQVPLSVAAFFGYTEVVELLLEKGADINGKDQGSKNTALIECAIRGQLETASFLLDRGASINQKDRHGQTALHLATKENKLEMVKLLLSRGADPYEQTGRGETVFEWAESFRRGDVGKVLADWVEEEALRKQAELRANKVNAADAVSTHQKNLARLDQLLGPRKRRGNAP